ncbi:hypothetical protein [Sphingorhabdus sp.]|jgi:hypothetical protein|uniref:hypothetical protein n=1 Tax=Sphingorhabdus sp. TaxID=1902408 RepID=UPI0037CAA366
MLADLEIALRRDRAYAQLAESYVHRATREDSLCLIKGRDAITAAWVNEDAAEITITADLEDMIAYNLKGWSGHRWVWREEGRILREIVVEDRGAPKVAPPVHPPLGELRPAQGQYAAGDTAILPPGFPKDARDIANWLHQAWNGRAFNLYDRAWLPALIRALPDATFYFEHAIVGDKQIAILWRVHGHHASGQRVRLIGSSVFTGDADDTVIDHAAMAAQIERGLIDYGS